MEIVLAIAILALPGGTIFALAFYAWLQRRAANRAAQEAEEDARIRRYLLLARERAAQRARENVDPMDPEVFEFPTPDDASADHSASTPRRNT